MRPDISVVIPLYNKQDDVIRAVQSAICQSFAPIEVIVVDDGSTDLSAERVGQIASPLVRLIRQQNAGVSVARNCGTEQARGEWVAFLDADDWWEDGFLAEIASMIEEFPGCGAYTTGFNIVSGHSSHPASTPSLRGIVENYFAQAIHKYICTGSDTVLPKAVLQEVGGFPAGMKLGEDQYLWACVAIKYDVCFSPQRLMNCSRLAQNRSASIYVAEQTRFAMRDLYSGGEDPCRDEYIAKVDLGKALIFSQKGQTSQAREAEQFYKWTAKSRVTWYKLFVINRLPLKWRSPIMRFYNRMAWVIAHKGI